MKTTTAVAALAFTLHSGDGVAEVGAQRGPFSGEEMSLISPALETYIVSQLREKKWKEADLSPRDRSIVTLAALIARQHTLLLPEQVELALRNGVTPIEISEIIAHLAFYAGLGNALAASAVIKPVFKAQGITATELTSRYLRPLPIDHHAEAARAARVAANLGEVMPGLVRDTTDVLFQDLWLRPDLLPRDRSLVTVVALVANNQDKQIPPHLNRAMDNGLTAEQASAVLSHLAYYVGWPNAFSAASVFKSVFEQRQTEPLSSKEEK